MDVERLLVLEDYDGPELPEAFHNRSGSASIGSTHDHYGCQRIVLVIESDLESFTFETGVWRESGSRGEQSHVSVFGPRGRHSDVARRKMVKDQGLHRETKQ